METSRDAIKSVKVYSLDEEKLKFRVILVVAAGAVAIDQGNYQFSLPPLTAYGNSNHYNQCNITLDGFEAHIQLIGTNDACWTTPAALSRVGSLEVRLDVPSAQTLINYNTNPFGPGGAQGDPRQGGYRCLVPFNARLIGNGAGAILGNMGDYSFQGDCGSNFGGPLMCGNPFGNTITVSNRLPGNDDRCWLVSAAAGVGAPDLGCYSYQFTITMIPNRD